MKAKKQSKVKKANTYKIKFKILKLNRLKEQGSPKPLMPKSECHSTNTVVSIAGALI